MSTRTPERAGGASAAGRSPPAGVTPSSGGAPGRPPGGAPGGPPGRRGNPRDLWRALGYLRAHRLDAVGALLALLAVSAATLAAPQLVRLAIDGGIARRSWHTVLVAVGGLLAVAAVRGLFAFVQGYLAERASQGVAYDLRDQLFLHIERLSFSFYDRVQTGQLLTRLTSDVEQIRTFAGTGVVQLLASLAMFTGTAVLLLASNARLAVVVLLAVVPIILLLLRFVKRVAPLFGLVQQSVGQLNTILREDLGGVRVVRAFAREAHEDARYQRVNDLLRERNEITVVAIANNFPFVFLFANLGTLAVIWLGGIQVIGGSLSIGELIAFNSYLAFLVQPLLTMGFLAAGISRGSASATRVFEVLDAPLEVADRDGAVPLPPIRQGVEFRSVCFRYPGTDRDVLHDVSFRVEAGQTVALLGGTGSGKSSLVNLVPRFYDVTGGAVLIDGHNVRDVTLESLRRQLGIVLQEARLFAGTVRENIAFGRPDATDAEIEAAARTAQAHEFVAELPLGYQTVVGERGVTLSGGQRQRLAIARALLVDPRLLILDDSTSAVDTATEAELRAALDRLMRDRAHTVLVIAQRVSTVRDADLILVLDQGRIVASGTHEELHRDSAIYSEILGSQLEDDAASTSVGVDSESAGQASDSDNTGVGGRAAADRHPATRNPAVP